MHSKIQLIGYSLMIVAYILLIFEKKGFAITVFIIAAILIATVFFIKKQSQHKGDKNSIVKKQSIGNDAEGEDIIYEDLEQSGSSIDSLEQKIGDRAKAKKKLEFRKVRQNDE